MDGNDLALADSFGQKGPPTLLVESNREGLPPFRALDRDADLGVRESRLESLRGVDLHGSSLVQDGNAVTEFLGLIHVVSGTEDCRAALGQVLQQDPDDRSRLIPIATIVPSESEAVYSVGPLAPEIGPLIFENTEVFPSMVEQLMKDPGGVLCKVAAYNVTDELDRNFAFSSQEVNERTAGVTSAMARPRHTASPPPVGST